MLLLFHNQLFPLENLSRFEKKTIFLFEDFERLKKFRFHKQKIIFEIACQRHFADQLWKKGFQVHYEKGDKPASLEDRLSAYIKTSGIKKITVFEIEDLDIKAKLEEFCRSNKIKLEVENSPIFFTPLKDFETYLNELEAAGARPMLRTFYQLARKKQKILVDKKGLPAGGNFSFESMNPMRLPLETRPKAPGLISPSPHVKEAQAIADSIFRDHPGSAIEFWWPTTREEALSWLEHFVSTNLVYYADYEDSLSTRSPLIYHSCLSALLNLGIITPSEVLHQVLEAGSKQGLSPQTLEPFIRQIVGWREYIRGIYHFFGSDLAETNFWNHKRNLKSCWYDGTTGLPFLDEAIKKAVRLGYNHPTERLMILSNLMLLCEADPKAAYKWFMEMHIDSAEWVTMPNVFGLGQYADGGIVSTRPYVCGSAYIRKMGHYPEGPWCDTLDGLYWSFIEKNAEVFATNARIAVALPALRRLDPHRREKIFAEADNFRNRVMM